MRRCALLLLAWLAVGGCTIDDMGTSSVSLAGFLPVQENMGFALAVVDTVHVHDPASLLAPRGQYFSVRETGPFFGNLDEEDIRARLRRNRFYARPETVDGRLKRGDTLLLVFRQEPFTARRAGKDYEVVAFNNALLRALAGGRCTGNRRDAGRPPIRVGWVH